MRIFSDECTKNNISNSSSLQNLNKPENNNINNNNININHSAAPMAKTSTAFNQINRKYK